MAGADTQRLCALLGVEWPIIQAPMAGVQDHRLAIAVAQTGALGSLPCAMLNPDAINSALATIQAATDRPCNVNFFCHTMPVPDSEREARWRARLAPYYREFGFSTTEIPEVPLRQPFGAAVADALEPHRPAVVSFHFGLPAADLLARVRSGGARILSTATTVEEALWLEAQGVDAIIAQGLEAGGHRGNFLKRTLDGQAPLRELLPRIAQAVQVPVIAAGGISDAEGVAAALALGAAGVQVGTAYLLTPEATTSPVHRQALAGPGAGDTDITTLFSGRPARGIVNRLMRELRAYPDVPEFPLAAPALGPLRARAEALGLGDFSSLWAGTRAKETRAMTAHEVTLTLAEACRP